MRSSATAAQSTRSPNVSCAAAEARSKLPFEVSDNLAQHLTLVSDPKDIVSEVELDRKRRLHLLIQRYISQIQHGCKNPSCTTPTCFSCRKRLAGSPVRRYTALSARTLACFLADARDPEAALCPYEPIHPAQLYSPPSVEKVSPSSSRRASAVSGLATGHKAQQHVHVNGTRPTTTQQSSKQTARRDGEEIHAYQTPDFANWAFLKPSPQPTKDPKSFTQALFDTLPLKLLEWIPPMPRRSTPQSPHVNQTQSKSGSAPEQLKANVHVEQIAAGNDRKHDPTLGDDEDDHEEAATTHLNGSAIANGHAKEPKPSILPRMSARKRYPATGGPSTSTPSVAGAREIGHKSTAQQSSQGQENDSENSPISREPRQNPQHSSNIGAEGSRSLSVPTLKSLSTGVLEELEALHNGAQNGICKPELSDFFKQSLYYCLKDPYRIAASFEAPEASGLDSGAPSSSAQKGRRFTLNAQSVRTNLRSMSMLCSWREIIRNVLIATHSLYIPTISRSPPLPTSLLNNRQAARVCVIGLYALSEVARTATDLPNIAPTSRPGHIHPEGQIQPFPKRILGFYNILDDVESLSLLEKIVNVVANRWTLWDISKAHRDTDLDDCAKRPPNMIQSILDYMADDANQMLETGAPMKASIERAGPCDARPDILDCGSLSVTTLYWLRALMVRNWDGKASVRKSETVGNVLQILAAMYEKHRSIGLEPADFWTKMLAKRFDPFDMPLEWLAFRSDNKTVHLLSYSFLFPPETLVTYFRAINYSRMAKSMESAALTKKAYDEFVASADSCQIPVAGREALEQRLGIIGPPRFVIQVRRDDVVTDAIKQIWRHQKRELLKPLKVRMGTDEGEEGVDSGGVQQEMFRVLFGEALDPSYGMFTVDEETRMTWFQPQSLEPLFNFEALGILMSLAVYNSITLPITFPIAFYRKLLGFKVKKLAHILDGWPVLARNLQSLLDWKDGDVGDVFLRTYEFSYEAFGQVTSVDMERHQRDMPWPPHPTRKGGGRVKTASFDVPPVPPDRGSATIVSNSALQAEDVPKDPRCQGVALEASLVTNANREQYVKDYVFWLTDKSIRPQFEAFARGFYTCLDRTALSIFTPEALQSFIEGVQEIDLDGLQASTAYDGYTADDEIVQWFWEVVKSWDHQKRRLLLEFITASDRVPVNGVTVIGLVIQCAGRSDEMLPRSMTCFATFLLPLYSSKDVLERMLGIAIEHAKGFGTI